MPEITLIAQDFPTPPKVGNPIVINAQVTAVDQDGTIRADFDQVESGEKHQIKTPQTSDEALDQFVAESQKEPESQ